MVTPFPLNKSTQVAEKSILDLFGKQTYLGNTFSLTSALSLADTVNNPQALITNPSTSGKAMFVFSRSIFSSADITVRYYIAPTVTAASVVVTPVNLRPAYLTASVTTINTTLTIGANGTLISQLDSRSSPSDILFVIDPGYRLLINAQAATGGVVGSIETVWYEI